MNILWGPFLLAFMTIWVSLGSVSATFESILASSGSHWETWGVTFGVLGLTLADFRGHFGVGLTTRNERG